MAKEKDDIYLKNILELQKKTTDAVEKFVDIALIQAESDRMNAEANLNYSKAIADYASIIKKIIDKQ